MRTSNCNVCVSHFVQAGPRRTELDSGTTDDDDEDAHKAMRATIVRNAFLERTHILFGRGGWMEGRRGR